MKLKECTPQQTGNKMSRGLSQMDTDQKKQALTRTLPNSDLRISVKSVAESFLLECINLRC